MKREYTVVYQTVEDGWIMATVPELPGAVSQGRDLDEARMMIKDAVKLLLESYREKAAHQLPENAVWETLTVDFATPA
jgi:predicted RNase H-like HicB family nuclease